MAATMNTKLGVAATTALIFYCLCRFQWRSPRKHCNGHDAVAAIRTFSLLPVISAAQNLPVVPSVQAPTASGMAVGAGSVAPAQVVIAGPSVAVPAGMFLGEGLVPLPAKLVQCISNLEFVEMYELLPESWLAAEGNEVANNGQARAVCIFPKRRKWLECYRQGTQQRSRNSWPTKHHCKMQQGI